MLSHAFHHRISAGISHSEPFPCDPADKGFAAGGAVEGHISGDHVVTGGILPVPGRIQDQLAAGQSFAEIIVGISFQLKGQPPGDKGSEALSPGALPIDGKGVFRQAVGILSGDLRTQDGADTFW